MSWVPRSRHLSRHDVKAERGSQPQQRRCSCEPGSSAENMKPRERSRRRNCASHRPGPRFAARGVAPLWLRVVHHPPPPPPPDPSPPPPPPDPGAEAEDHMAFEKEPPSELAEPTAPKLLHPGPEYHEGKYPPDVELGAWLLASITRAKLWPRTKTTAKHAIPLLCVIGCSPLGSRGCKPARSGRSRMRLYRPRLKTR